MNDTIITVQGYVGSEVKLHQAGDTVVANFRVGCTPRYFSQRANAWTDATTQWFSVNVWRGLADNVAKSLIKGDAVVVHGRLNAVAWRNRAGEEVTSWEIQAVSVGHDLNRGSTRLARNERRAPDEAASTRLDPWNVPAGTVLAPEEEPDREPGEQPEEVDQPRRDPLTDWAAAPAA